jgi:S-formylglutathione hydrolase FrmB
MKRSSLVFLCLLLILSGSADAQAPAAKLPSGVSESRLASKLMGRPMPYRIILPAGYAASKQKRYPVIYLLHGLFGGSDNWTTLTKLPQYAKDHEFIIVNPEGGNGWYTDSASKTEDRYESYIAKELIPEIDARYRTVAKRNGRVIAGLSMGGYGALKFGVKYPEMFSLAGSFSGALGATSYRSTPALAVLLKSLDETFGPVGSETRKGNDLFALVRDASPEKVKSFPFIYLDCGTEDFLFQNNREFVALLNEKKVRHEYRELPGGHEWPYWDAQVAEFLRIANRFVNKV